jgi:SAM-dependent methyltransferase
MAQALEPVSGELVDAAEVSGGDRVVDIATGTGNAALLAAAHGASVVGVDLEPSLLALARERGVELGVEVEFVEGEVQRLPVGDGQADVVLSAFGVMYALDHAAAARELVRVLAPSGRIALAAWAPGSLMPAMGAVIASYLPPPPSASASPSRWGDPRSLSDLLTEAGARLSATRSGQLDLRFEHAEAAADFLIRTAGHIVSQAEQLTAAGRWRALRQELVTFVVRQGEERSDGLVLHLDYLIAVAECA